MSIRDMAYRFKAAERLAYNGMREISSDSSIVSSFFFGAS
jgi:hypothetical protein